MAVLKEASAPGAPGKVLPTVWGFCLFVFILDTATCFQSRVLCTTHDDLKPTLFQEHYAPQNILSPEHYAPRTLKFFPKPIPPKFCSSDNGNMFARCAGRARSRNQFFVAPLTRTFCPKGVPPAAGTLRAFCQNALSPDLDAHAHEPHPPLSGYAFPAKHPRFSSLSALSPPASPRKDAYLSPAQDLPSPRHRHCPARALVTEVAPSQLPLSPQGPGALLALAHRPAPPSAHLPRSRRSPGPPTDSPSHLRKCSADLVLKPVPPGGRPDTPHPMVPRRRALFCDDGAAPGAPHARRANQ